MQDFLSLCECFECPLANSDGSPRGAVQGRGDVDADLVLVGEAPGANEVRDGKPFIGKSGQLLDLVLEDVGLRREEVYVTNAVLCRPDEGAPTAQAIRCCRPRLLAELAAVAPKLIMPLGNSAVRSLLQTQDGITKVMGAVYKPEDIGVHCLPTIHPAAILHGGYDWFDDLHNALRRAKRVVVDGEALPEGPPEVSYTHVQPRETAPDGMTRDLRRALQAIEAAPVAALDLETEGFRYLHDKILQVAVYDGEHAWVIDYEAFEQVPSAKAFFKELLQSDKLWILHNLSFDFQFLQYNFGVVPARAEDTMVFALGLTEQGNRVGLKRLAREWFNAPAYEEKLKPYLKNKKTKWSAIPRDILAEYAACDVYYTYHLRDKLVPLVEAEGTMRLCYRLLLPAQKCFANLEYRGTKVDIDYIQKLERIWEPRIALAIKDLVTYARRYDFDARKLVKSAKKADLNPRSPKQLMHFLFEMLRLPYPQERGRAVKTTGKPLLEKYPDHPFVARLKELRTMDKMMRTYVYGIEDDIWGDGRVHPDFLLFGTRTGRLAIRNPPLQTIPESDMERHKFDSIRRLFVASPGYKFVEADYKSLELRVAWHYSEDEALGRALEEEDFHTAIACRVFHVKPEEVSMEMRLKSKAVTFGLMYGRQAHSLADTFKCSPNEAQAYIDAYFASFPAYAQWWKDTQRLVFDQQYLITTLGRKRRWNLITPENAQDVKNQSVNFPIQGTASDINLLALIKLDTLLPVHGYGYPLFAVHDSICFDIKEEHLDPALAMIREVMEEPPFETCATFPISIKIGEYWE